MRRASGLTRCNGLNPSAAAARPAGALPAAMGWLCVPHVLHPISTLGGVANSTQGKRCGLPGTCTTTAALKWRLPRGKPACSRRTQYGNFAAAAQMPAQKGGRYSVSVLAALILHGRGALGSFPPSHYAAAPRCCPQRCHPTPVIAKAHSVHLLPAAMQPRTTCMRLTAQHSAAAHCRRAIFMAACSIAATPAYSRVASSSCKQPICWRCCAALRVESAGR